MDRVCVTRDEGWRSRVVRMPARFCRSQHEGMAPLASLPSARTLCSMSACSSQAADPCTYTDRRGQSCSTAFCSAHSVSVAGVPYCRRHAGTLVAIGELAQNPRGLPDVADRGPALVNCIVRDLDKDIRSLLAGPIRPGERLIVDDAVHLIHDQWRRARWERSWRIVEPTGRVLAVTVHVAEDDQSRVRVRVAAEMVADTVPPWIARRSQGVEVGAAIDISQRQRFYQRLEENIAAAVTRLRSREDSIAAQAVHRS